jgi:hypothetical protein
VTPVLSAMRWTSSFLVTVFTRLLLAESTLPYLQAVCTSQPTDYR